MGIKEIEDYVSTLNELKKQTGLLIADNTILYDCNKNNSFAKAVAEIIWDSENQEFYARYIN